MPFPGQSKCSIMAQTTRYEPLPRYGHASIHIGGKLLLWGGYVDSMEASKELATTVELLDIVTRTWERRMTFGKPPPGSWLTAYTAVGESVYSFGGFDGKDDHNSLHQLNIKTWQWNELIPINTSTIPLKKIGSRMVPLDGERLLIFAGETKFGYTDELHIFDIPSECASNFCW